MAKKIISLFFSLVFFSLLGTAQSQTLPTDQNCSVRLEKNEAWVLCSAIKRKGEAVVSADFLRQLNLSDEKSNATYLLREYPHPITWFRLSQPGGIKIKENALKALPNLTSLSLQITRGNVTIPSEEFKNTPDLKTFNIWYGTIPASTLQAIQSAPKLEHLKLYGTNGGELKADSLQGLLNLKTIEITSSRYISIEQGTFDGLTELTTLDLVGNNISSIVSVLPKDSSKLNWLELRYNAISTIPKSAFAKYKQLTTIYLSGNKIIKLEPGVFEGLENLVQLYLNENPIQQLPEDDLQKMINLETFSLDDTNITKINSTTFKGLRNMTHLSLKTCKALTTIEPGSFDDFVSVTTLDSQHNQRLTTLPDGLFKNMKSLKIVDFWDTCVQNLSRANFTHCPNLAVALFGQGSCAASV